jgi:hypothetical protein
MNQPLTIDPQYWRRSMWVTSEPYLVRTQA